MGRAGGISRRGAFGLAFACLACLACRPAAAQTAAPASCGDPDGELTAATEAGLREHRARRGPHRVLVRSWPEDPVHGTLAAETPRLAAQAGLDALAAYRAAGFPAPVLSRDGTLVVELRNLAGARGATYPCQEHIAVERGLRPAALRDTVFHETFHRVQYAANPTDMLVPAEDEPVFFTPMQREGGARVMEALARATPTRYEEEAEGWFLPGGQGLGHVRTGPRRSLIGPSYAGGLFWAYAAEQCGGPEDAPFAREIRSQRALLEATRTHPGPVTIATLRAARALMPGGGPGDFDRFLYLDGDRALPACAETLWGNFLLALALNGTAGADSRFRFGRAGDWRGIAGRPAAIPPAHHLSLPAEAEPAPLGPYACHAFRLPLDGGGRTGLVRLRWQPLEGMGDALVQVAALDRAGELRDLFRHDAAAGGALDRVLPCRDLSALVILVATRLGAGRCRLQLEAAPDAPILASTLWNAQDNRLLTHDPAIRAHDWRSLDLGLGDRVITEAGGGSYRLLMLSLRNRGTRPAAAIAASAQWRPLRGGAWQPLEVHLPPPPLVTDDECRRLLAEETAEPGRDQLPCAIHAGSGLPLDRRPTRDRATAMFRWRGPDIRGALIRVTAQAEGDPNGPLAVLSSFGGAPPMQPLSP